MYPNGKLFKLFSICATTSRPYGGAKLSICKEKVFWHQQHHQLPSTSTPLPQGCRNNPKSPTYPYATTVPYFRVETGDIRIFWIATFPNLDVEDESDGKERAG